MQNDNNLSSLQKEKIEITPSLSFWAISDSHGNSDLCSESNRIVKNALIDMNEIKPNADALCFVGDMTDSGAEEEYETLHTLLDLVPHPTPYFVIGNHDIRWHKGGFQEAYDIFIRQTKMSGGYYDKWLNGFHFLFLSTDDDLKDEATLSDTQLEWLNKKLAENANISKPIFVFLHQSMKNTSAGSYPEHGYGTSGYPDGIVQEQRLRTILSQYPQCLFISGHTHAVAEHPKTVFTDDGFTCVNTSSICYTISLDGYGLDNESQGLFFEVYQNKVVIKGRDFTHRKWISNAQWEISIPVKN